MTELLNLDELATKREIAVEFMQKRHVMREQTVGAYMKLIQLSQGIDEEDSVKMLEVQLKIIASSFPTMSADDLKQMTMPQAKAIINFMNEVMSSDLEGNDKEEAPKKAK